MNSNKKLVAKKIESWELLLRPCWEGISKATIERFAREGQFGLYFMPSNEEWVAIKKTSWPLKKYLRELIMKSKGEERKSYEILVQKYLTFCREKKWLLKNKPGLCRLATDIEIEIFQLCAGGSVRLLDENSRIVGTDYNNHFGLVFIDGKIKSPGYYFYKKEIKFKDLYMLEDQIKKFEENILFTQEVDEGGYKKPKSKQKRFNGLHELIGELHETAEDKSANAIWKQLKVLANDGNHSILSRVDSWSDPNAKIHWVSPRSVPRTTGRRAFQNEISKRNTKVEKILSRVISHDS